jgi:alpha-galactosidase
MTFQSARMIYSTRAHTRKWLFTGALFGCLSGWALGCSNGAAPGVGTGGAENTGGTHATGGNTTTGGSATGGRATEGSGGAPQATGGSAAGSAATGGGIGTGGAAGNAQAGGTAAGGALQATGGMNTGGATSTSGGSIGGKAAGGSTSGGTGTGGKAAGGGVDAGTGTGGKPNGGAVTGGTSTGGASGGNTSTGGTTATGILAATPPMGWNSWNKFAGGITDTLVRGIADALVSSGMQAAGYQYINIDDMWQASSRDSSGNIVPSTSKFPNGMKAVADYVHGKGLKLGLYSDRGTKTCAGLPGSYSYETKDAQSYASWGVDYLKYDNCSPAAGSNTQTDYTNMANALKTTGRPILFSICAWWFYDWGTKIGQMWRTGTDIIDSWDGGTDATKQSHSFISLLNNNGGWSSRYSKASYGSPGLAQYAGPGHWNDPDMLEVGNGGMTDTEYQSHFSLWAIMAAPLIAGNDVRNMSATTKSILTNADVIAIDQDPLGIQGKPISTSTTLEVWSKKLTGTQTYAVVLFNRTTASADIAVTWVSLGMTSSSATVRDLWAHTDLGSIATQYQATVPSHGVVMLRVVGD